MTSSAGSDASPLLDEAAYRAFQLETSVASVSRNRVWRAARQQQAIGKGKGGDDRLVRKRDESEREREDEGEEEGGDDGDDDDDDDDGEDTARTRIGEGSIPPSLHHLHHPSSPQDRDQSQPPQQLPPPRRSRSGPIRRRRDMFRQLDGDSLIALGMLMEENVRWLLEGVPTKESSREGEGMDVDDEGGEGDEGSGSESDEESNEEKDGSETEEEDEGEEEEEEEEDEGDEFERLFGKGGKSTSRARGSLDGK